MIYAFEDYALDTKHHELRCAGQAVALEPKVFQVLLYLVQPCDRVITKDELFEHCWPGTFVSEAALTRCLVKIHQAVHTDQIVSPLIKTIHRQGYRFMAAVTTSDDYPSQVSSATPPRAVRTEPLPPVSLTAPEDLTPPAFHLEAPPACSRYGTAPAWPAGHGAVKPKITRPVPMLGILMQRPPGIDGCIALQMHMVSAHPDLRGVVRDCTSLASA